MNKRTLNGTELPDQLKGIDKRLIEDNYPTTCKKCGGKLVWDQDTSLTETGYLPDCVDEQEDHMVHIFTCSECGRMHEYEYLGEGYFCRLATYGTRGGSKYTSRAIALSKV